MGAPRFMYFTLGRSLVHYLQCQYSILSLLRFRQGRDFRVVAITDNPDYYRWMGDAVELLEVDAATVSQWRGPSDFFWRTKIVAIQTAWRADPNAHLVYLDGDTFFRHPPDPLLQRLDRGDCLMHLREYNVATTRRSVARQLWRLHGGREYAGVPCTRHSEMWNAGVVGIAAGQGSLIDATLACLDGMEGVGTDKYNEQFALSLVLSASGRLQPADDVVDHYWGNKRRWNAAIARHLLQALLSGESAHQAADRLVGGEPALAPWQRDPWLWRKWLKRDPEYRLLESILG